MQALTYSNVSKSYGRDGAPAVHDVSFEVAEAELVVFLGPSGCGKTTLLKMTNRLIEPTSGVIALNGRDIAVQSATDLRRHMGYVIQQVGLFPHLTVGANVGTVPRLLGWARSRIAERTEELLDLVGLPAGEYQTRYPHQLSGGQQQRVGLARALAADPSILLMDEPFGAIDAITRSRLQDQLVEIQRRVRKTVLFVTHDVDEALRLADKILVMRDGTVVQYDTPFNVLTQPKDNFVRDLLDADDVFRELGLITVESAMTWAEPNGEQSIESHRSVREALSVMISTGTSALTVVGTTGAPVGTITMHRIQELGNRSPGHLHGVPVAVEA